MTTLLSRPKNTTINHLGCGVTWRSPLTYDLVSSIYAATSNLFLEYAIKLLWTSGVLYRRHPFSHFLYLLAETHTLPIVPEGGISRYFRLIRLKYSTRFRSKRFFLTRRFLHYLNITEFYIYRILNQIVILLYLHIPEPLKRFHTTPALVVKRKWSKNSISVFIKNIKLLKLLLHDKFTPSNMF